MASVRRLFAPAAAAAGAAPWGGRRWRTAAADGGAAPVPLERLRTPAYYVDLDVATRNAQRMLQTAERLGCRLRPHVKTHKTVEMALLQTGGRRSGITVSTLAEARFFAQAGFRDILYAVPISVDKLPEAAGLIAALGPGNFSVTVDQPEQVDALLAWPDIQVTWPVVVMVDCGYHRDGVDPTDPASLDLVQRLAAAPNVAFVGLYTHGGHSYDATGEESIRSVAAAERDAVVGMAAALGERGVACPMVGIGSTPTCSRPPLDGLAGVTEMHPGNYIFYDTMQASIASCGLEDVAVRVLTRVLGHYPRQNMMLVDMGWTAQGGGQGKEQGYGAFPDNPDLAVAKLKQEAGEVTSSDGSPIDFARYPVGSLLHFAPFHSCASGHCHPTLKVVQNGQIVGELEVAKGW